MGLGAAIGAAVLGGAASAYSAHQRNKALDRQYNNQVELQQEQYQAQWDRYNYYVNKVLPLKEQANSLATAEAVSAAEANAQGASIAIAEIMAEAKAAVQELAEQTREKKDYVNRQKRVKLGQLQSYYSAKGVEMAGTPMLVMVDQLNKFAKSYDNLNRTYNNRKRAIETRASLAAQRYAMMAAQYERQAQYSLLAGQLRNKQLIVEAEGYKPGKLILPPKPHHTSVFGSFMMGTISSGANALMGYGLNSIGSSGGGGVHSVPDIYTGVA